MSDPSIEFTNSFIVLVERWHKAVVTSYHSQIAMAGLDIKNCPTFPVTNEDWKKIKVAAESDMRAIIRIYMQKVVVGRGRNETPPSVDGEDPYDVGYESGYGEGETNGRQVVHEDLEPVIEELRMRLAEASEVITSQTEDIETAQKYLRELEEQLDEVV